MQVLQGLLDSVDKHDLTIGRFMDLSHTLGCASLSLSLFSCRHLVPDAVRVAGSQPSSSAKPASTDATAATADGPTEPSTESLDAAFASLDKRLRALHAALPPLTALIVFTGHSSPVGMSRLAAKKARFDKLWKTTKQSEIADEDKWYEQDDRALLDEVERARWGLSFFCVK